jgi:SAM-dependent methyltransferase
MEHLHVEDAEAQLQEIHRVLRPGGHYVCTTPSVITGPHDILGVLRRGGDGHAHAGKRLSLTARPDAPGGFRPVEFPLVVADIGSARRPTGCGSASNGLCNGFRLD